MNLPDLIAHVASVLGRDEVHILSAKEYPDGIVAVTDAGQKLRLGGDGVEVLTGPPLGLERATVIEAPPVEPPKPEELGPVPPVGALPTVEVEEPEPAEPAVEEPRPDHFEVFKGDGGWYFRRVAANGEIVAASESYRRRKDAKAEAERQADGLEVRLT